MSAPEPFAEYPRTPVKLQKHLETMSDDALLEAMVEAGFEKDRVMCNDRSVVIRTFRETILTDRVEWEKDFGKWIAKGVSSDK